MYALVVLMQTSYARVSVGHYGGGLGNSEFEAINMYSFGNTHSF